MNENTNKIIAHIVAIVAATYITYRLFIYKAVLTFDEKIPTAAGGTNNPGNIEKPNGRGPFRGEIIEDNGSRFTSFQSMAHGYRAIRKILNTKYSHGLKTLRSMIESYAPPEDGNNVDAYVSFISNATTVNPDLDWNSYSDGIKEDVVKAIGTFEQGQDWTAKYASLSNDWVHSGYTMT